MAAKVAVCSLFRSNASFVAPYFSHICDWQYPNDRIVVVCVEGDSTDDTPQRLLKAAKRYRKSGLAVIVDKYDLGAPHYPSVIDPNRLSVLAKTWNRGLELALLEKPDYVLILDSDIRTPTNLLSRLLSRNKDVIAPMFFVEGADDAKGQGRFRDTWAYWAGTRSFTERHPYHIKYCRGVFEVDGVGVPLIKASVLRAGARFTEAEEVKGLCREIKTRGYRIYVDGTIAVWHPPLADTCCASSKSPTPESS